jgi:hypothetical protein
MDAYDRCTNLGGKNLANGVVRNILLLYVYHIRNLKPVMSNQLTGLLTKLSDAVLQCGNFLSRF